MPSLDLDHDHVARHQSVVVGLGVVEDAVGAGKALSRVERALDSRRVGATSLLDRVDQQGDGIVGVPGKRVRRLAEGGAELLDEIVHDGLLPRDP